MALYHALYMYHQSQPRASVVDLIDLPDWDETWKWVGKDSTWILRSL